MFSAFGDNASHNAFQILQLNGIAAFTILLKAAKTEIFFIKSDTDAADCLQQFVLFVTSGERQNTFYCNLPGNWAIRMHQNTFEIECCLLIIWVMNITILVVIGYSFLYFNRNTDKQIFDKLKESGKLKKIYFQDPYLEDSFLKNQFGLNDIEIEHVKRIDSFFVPMEL